jgi:hypothetical protein
MDYDFFLPILLHMTFQQTQLWRGDIIIAPRPGQGEGLAMDDENEVDNMPELINI